MPVIFSSSSVEPVGRSMPGLVPMPSSPRKRAPSSVAELGVEHVLALLGRGLDDLARPRTRAARPAPRRRRGRTARRTGPRRWRSVSCGPVKTSPRGQVAAPSEFCHVAAADLRRERSVPSAFDADRRSRCGEALAERGLHGREVGPGAGRIGAVEHQGAVHEVGVLRRARARRARRAPSVGMIVRHQGVAASTCGAAPGGRGRAGPRGRDRRRRAARGPGAWMRTSLVAASSSASAIGDGASSWASAAWSTYGPREPLDLDAQRRPGAALEDRRWLHGRARAASATDLGSARTSTRRRARSRCSSRRRARRAATAGRSAASRLLTDAPSRGSTRPGACAATRARTCARPGAPSGSGRAAPCGR